MLDMDQTLIESVFPDDKRYDRCPGKIIKYYDVDNEMVTLKVNVRPYALHLVKTIRKHGHEYVIWSAGTYYYVHAVMNYFSSLVGFEPDVIYTRDDMVEIGGNRRKSLKSKQYDSNYVIIVEDHPEFIDPTERKNVISVNSWTFDYIKDVELQWISQFLAAYGVVSSFHNGNDNMMLMYHDTCNCPEELAS